MIKILHVITSLEQGGAESMLVRLLRGMDRKSFQQSVVSLTTRGVYGDLVESSGIPLTTLGMTGFISMPGCLAKLGSSIKAHQPDIIQTWLYHADLLGFLAARMVDDISVAWNTRCANLETGDVPKSTFLLRWILAKLSSQPEAVLFNSVAGQQAHLDIGYRPVQSLVIPNGFDLDGWQPDHEKRVIFRAEIGVDDSIFLVGMVARYHRMKDHNTFLKAAAHLKSNNPNVRFVLVGSGINWDNSNLVKGIKHHGLQDCVTLLGERSDMPSVMAGLDCLVSTSTSEGFPNVLGEAMACGVPCVATDAGDSRLILGHTGKIVPIGNVDGIVSGVRSLMSVDTQTSQNMSKQCRQHIKMNYDLDMVVIRYADFYKDLYAESQSR